MKTGILTCGLLLAMGTTVLAEVVAEWKFDGPAPLSGGEVVDLDTFAASASGKSVLMAASSYTPEPTGISDKWQPFLGKGFLEVHQGKGNDSANQHGLVTKNTLEEKIYPAGNASYRSYLGFAGLGSGGRGGTVYLVVSPRAWESSGFALFGTGHLGGHLLLSVEKGELRFSAGEWGSGTQRTAATVAQGWQPDSWYFVAISWSGGQGPVLYVREMAPAGPKASPDALMGTFANSVPEISEQPRFDPLVIGARWVNSGGPDSLFTTDGANARFAYARIDNEFSSKEVMETVFEGLVAP